MSQRIEFMGLPASGKSTLCHSLTAELHRRAPGIMQLEQAIIRCLKRRDDGVLCNILKRMPYVVWEPICGMRNALTELHAFASENVPAIHLVFEVMNRISLPPAWRQCTTYAFFKLFAEQHLFEAHIRDDEGVIVEEGFALGVFTLFGYLPKEILHHNDIENYITHFPRPDAVFWIDTNPSECFVRLQKRPELPLLLQGKNSTDVVEQLQHGFSCLQKAVTELERRGVPIFHVSNSKGQLETLRRHIRKAGVEWLLNNEGKPDQLKKA